MEKPAPGDGGAEHMSRLGRRLGLFDAVVVGLGSMIGAGVFVSVAPAARAAGNLVWLALAIAAVIAFANATSSARLAARHPVSGGAYAYGRLRLGRAWGVLAGSSFVLGKIASCAAMAMTFASYAAPSWGRPVAFAAIAATTALNVMGIKKTALATRIIVVVVLAALATSVAAMLAGGQTDLGRLRPAFGASALGVFHAAAIMFFAFAGYARIATLGEEVRDPERTIPRAIATSFVTAVAVYAAVIVAVLVSLDIGALASSPAPLAAAVSAGRFAALAPVVRLGAAVACFGVLLSLQAGVGRTIFAMAEGADLPRWLGAVDEQRGVPRRAELVVGLSAAALVLVTGVGGAIGLSSFAVLLYYAVTNAAALRLGPSERPPPRWLAVLGLAGCVTLAFAVPAALAR